MKTQPWLKLLQQVCSLATAPFAEEAVVAYLRRFAKAHAKLILSTDAIGNVLILLPGSTGAHIPRWIFTAHMDHPGFVSERMLDDHTLSARFHGGVFSQYLNNAKVRFFSAGNEINGVVTMTSDEGSDRPDMPSRAIIRVMTPVAPASPGMFDLGEGRIKSGRFLSRVCDDLAGLAAGLAMLHELHAKPPAATMGLLCTRAEEDGFIGAIGAVLNPVLLNKTDRLIAIECSAEQPFASLGGGAIIRTGDKTSVFNSALTWFLSQQAQLLSLEDKLFKYQRALMPGGTCEATVYDAWGYVAGSLCVPLANYHNMDVTKEILAPESIKLNDWTSMVKLFVQVARSATAFDPKMSMLKDRLGGRYNRLKHLL